MLKSMTGFGKSEMMLPDKKIIIEIKCLNSKGTDISLKIPGVFRSREMEIKQLLSERLERGKIDMSLTLEMIEESANLSFNSDTVKSYYSKLSSLSEELNIPAGEALFSAILRIPEIYKNERTERTEPDEAEWTSVLALLHKAIDETEKFRIQEGEILNKDIMKRINLILQKLEEIKPFEKPRIERIKERISNSLSELKLPDEPDKNRFEQEIIYYLEKLDITEEKVRLRNHCNYFLETIGINESVGKKLGFISQEIGREINTLGSKASDSDIQKRVVEMKDELEKVKEQVLNIV